MWSEFGSTSGGSTQNAIAGSEGSSRRRRSKASVASSAGDAEIASPFDTGQGQADNQPNDGTPPNAVAGEADIDPEGDFASKS